MEKSARLIISSGELSSDIRYAAGFSTPDPFIWFGCQGRSICLMSALEYERAAQSAPPHVEVKRESDYGAHDFVTLVAILCRDFKVSTLEVPCDFPVIYADALRRRGLNVLPIDGHFFPEREFKRPEEVELIRESLRGAEAGVRRAFEVISESTIGADEKLFWQGEVLTSDILRSEIDCTMLRRNLLPTGTICAGGLQASLPHNPGEGPLYAHTPIVMDIFPRSLVHGYWGDLTRTVTKGEPLEIVDRAYHAVFAAREHAFTRVAIGANPAAIHQAAEELMTALGFPTGMTDRGYHGFFHGLGHGVGLDIHEEPRISPRNTQALRGGEVFTLEPGLYYPEWGGIRLEDMVYLHHNGHCERLTEVENPWIL